MTNQERTVHVIMVDTPDSYDIGSHDEPLEMFADRDMAKFVIGHLIGMPSKQEWDGGNGWRKWSDHDFEIKTFTLR